MGQDNITVNGMKKQGNKPRNQSLIHYPHKHEAKNVLDESSTGNDTDYCKPDVIGQIRYKTTTAKITNQYNKKSDPHSTNWYYGGPSHYPAKNDMLGQRRNSMEKQFTKTNENHIEELDENLGNTPIRNKDQSFNESEVPDERNLYRKRLTTRADKPSHRNTIEEESNPSTFKAKMNKFWSFLGCGQLKNNDRKLQEDVTAKAKKKRRK